MNEQTTQRAEVKNERIDIIVLLMIFGSENKLKKSYEILSFVKSEEAKQIFVTK
jgi:hypothetical protein